MTDKSTEKIEKIEKIESSKFVVMGQVDAGKSSLTSVLVKGVVDDGNGYARSLIVKLKHEQDSGRTSSHTSYYIVNKNEITTLVDLCGHEKYLKTTIGGLGMFPDYGLVVIGANMGLIGMTREHMGLLIANKIPFIIVITKIDLCPVNIMLELKKELGKIAKRNRKEIIYFEDEQKEENGSYLGDSHKAIMESFHSRNTTVLPIIMVSNKTGYNINFTRELITNLRSQTYLQKMNIIIPKVDTIKEAYPQIFFIDSTFNVNGIGLVLSGTVKFGKIQLGQNLFLGPVNNTYISVTIKSMHNCVSENVTVLEENMSGSVGVRFDTKGSYTREMFSRGQILTTDKNFAMKNTCYSFTCQIAVFNHSTSIRNGFQTTIHCGSLRQTSKFRMKEDQILRTNSREIIDIKFISRPEFILPDTLFMFRDGRTKGIGKIIKGIPFTEDTFEPITRRKREKSKKRSEKRKEKREKKVHAKLKGQETIDTAIDSNTVKKINPKQKKKKNTQVVDV